MPKNQNDVFYCLAIWQCQVADKASIRHNDTDQSWEAHQVGKDFFKVQSNSSTFRNCEEVNIKVSNGTKVTKALQSLKWLLSACLNIGCPGKDPAWFHCKFNFMTHSNEIDFDLKNANSPWLFPSFSSKKHNLRNWHAEDANTKVSTTHAGLSHLSHLSTLQGLEFWNGTGHFQILPTESISRFKSQDSSIQVNGQVKNMLTPSCLMVWLKQCFHHCQSHRPFKRRSIIQAIHYPVSPFCCVVAELLMEPQSMIRVWHVIIWTNMARMWHNP